VDHIKGLIELVPDIHMKTRAFLRSEGGVSLRWAWSTGTDVNGAPVEFEYVNVGVAKDGVSARLEIFPPERFEDAVARFEALGKTDSTGPLENECTRNWDRIAQTFVDRAWDELAETISDSILFEDRRSSLHIQAEGADAFVDQLKVVADMGPILISDIIATRGDRVALFRVEWRDPRPLPDAFTVEALHVHEVDDEGRLTAAIVFDPADRDAARAELEARQPS
jgi:hypothetical protein